MEITEPSTLSFDYESVSDSDENDGRCSSVGSNKEEFYGLDGDYRPYIEGSEDSKLQNWNRWLKYRKKQYGRLKDAMKRDADQLIMNSEDVYKKKLAQHLIDGAYDYVKFDKYRGDPKFWKDPNYMYDDCGKVVNCPVQGKFDRTADEKNEAPTLQHIAIPSLVKYEKGLLTNFKEKNTFHKCDYLEQRKTMLKSNIKLIESFTPDAENLFLLGEQIRTAMPITRESVEDVSSDTVIIVEGVRAPEKDEYRFKDTRWPVLKVQDITIDKDVLNHSEGDIEQVIQFTNCSANESYIKKLVIENVGNVCVRYAWEQVEQHNNPKFPLRYSNQLIKRFYFPTTSNVFIPGQITEIPICFKSREPGVYDETWNLILNPKLSKDKFIRFSLQGFIRAEIDRTEPMNVESYVNKCRATTESRNLLDVIFVDSKLSKPIPYDTLFALKDVFLHNNPDHFYEFEKVQALAELFKKVSGDLKWDLSIITLRNDILRKVESLGDKREYLSELYNISNSLLKQNVAMYIDKEKYRSVYQILCSFVNTMEKDSKHLKIVHGLVVEELSATSLDSTANQEDSKGALRKSVRRSRMSSATSGRKKSRQNESIKIRNSASIASQKSSAGSWLPSAQFLTETASELKLGGLTSRYLKALSIQTYQNLSTAIDEITAVIESLNIILDPSKTIKS